MTLVFFLAFILSIALGIYLVIALFKPELFA
ncbi:K(+)-transporting ATPase subunit F [bacterium]|nr:K(+)-transporting ATPase subunit F [bacterium]QQR58644.1 MAG: K(+)-transporting ATPase subunit F [Candidatus Melainabacteria bacterium]